MRLGWCWPVTGVPPCVVTMLREAIVTMDEVVGTVAVLVALCASPDPLVAALFTCNGFTDGCTIIGGSDPSLEVAISSVCPGLGATPVVLLGVITSEGGIALKEIVVGALWGAPVGRITALLGVDSDCCNGEGEGLPVGLPFASEDTAIAFFRI